MAPVGPRKPCEGPHGVHDLGLLADKEFPRTKNSRALWIINSACVSSLFTGTNRIEGRDTASQIASASA